MAAALSSDSPTGEYYIYEIPMSKRRELSLHLDRLDAWLALAQQMQFSPDQMEVSGPTFIIYVWLSIYTETYSNLTISEH